MVESVSDRKLKEGSEKKNANIGRNQGTAEHYRYTAYR